MFPEKKSKLAFIEPTIEELKSIDGKDFGMLGQREKIVFDHFSSKGRKYGVSVNVQSKGAEEHLTDGMSKAQREDILSRYLSVIKVVIE